MLKTTGRAAMLVLLWVATWTVAFGGFAEAFIDPSGETLDIWPAELAIPGLAGGIVFAALLQVFERRRHLAEVPIRRLASWGALTGLVLGILTATSGGPIPLPLNAAEAIGVGAGLSTLAALASARCFRVLARWPARRLA